MANTIPLDTRNEIERIRTEIDKTFENLYSRNLFFNTQFDGNQYV